LKQADELCITIKTSTGVKHIHRKEAENKWHLVLDNGEVVTADTVLIATGSSQRIWDMLGALGHTIVPPAPSLFTFNIKSDLINGLEGLSVEGAVVTIADSARLSSSGPLLITHWGLSGPAVLKLSAWGARYLADVNYRFGILVNWTTLTFAEVLAGLKEYKNAHPKKNVPGNPLFGLPKRLWERFSAGIHVNYADLSNKQLETLATLLTAMRFAVDGKSTFKEEFVTAGGVDLSEVDFKTMQSKKLPGLYFAGEALDIDAVTGGFNFQAAWTTAWIAGNSI
jgi:predicted Rossmann fold flavoprotein